MQEKKNCDLAKKQRIDWVDQTRNLKFQINDLESFYYEGCPDYKR